MKNIALMTIFVFIFASGCAAQTKGGATAKIVGGTLFALAGSGGAISSGLGVGAAVDCGSPCASMQTAGAVGLVASFTLAVTGFLMLGTGISELNWLEESEESVEARETEKLHRELRELRRELRAGKKEPAPPPEPELKPAPESELKPFMPDEAGEEED